MAGNEVKLTNGQRWSTQHFVDHYQMPTGSGTPTPVAGPPEPVDVDMSWYMGEGPGRYYHPGMFPIIHQIMDSRSIAPGVYDLEKLAADKEALKAEVSHYGLDMRSADFPMRAIVFGRESARISGQVTVNKDGSKTFQKIEIRPFDTNFDFEHNTWNPLLEGAREAGSRKYDPEHYGRKYEIQYRGRGHFDEPYSDRGLGRVYQPFTASQLSAALRKESVYPGRASPGLLPSYTAAPPPAINEHLQYLDQSSGKQAQAAAPGARGPLAGSASFANRNSLPRDVGNWVASLAGVDPADPTRPQQGVSFGGDSSKQRLLPPWVFFGLR
jgi:hypothetical protein